MLTEKAGGQSSSVGTQTELSFEIDEEVSSTNPGGQLSLLETQIEADSGALP